MLQLAQFQDTDFDYESRLEKDGGVRCVYGTNAALVVLYQMTILQRLLHAGIA